jgi:hypothetical protein
MRKERVKGNPQNPQPLRTEDEEEDLNENRMRAAAQARGLTERETKEAIKTPPPPAPHSRVQRAETPSPRENEGKKRQVAVSPWMFDLLRTPRGATPPRTRGAQCDPGRARLAGLHRDDAIPAVRDDGRVRSAEQVPYSG